MLEKPQAAVPPAAAPKAAPAKSTLRAYAADFRAFEAWCKNQHRTALPAVIGTVVMYLDALAAAGRKLPTIEQSLNAIAHAHRTSGYGWQHHRLLQETLDGIRQRVGRETTRKAPVTDAVLRAMLASFGTDLRGVRNRAILTVGRAAALSRAEITALSVADVAFAAEGMELTLRNKKKTVTVAAEEAICPVRSLRRWLDEAKITEGPVFRAISRSGKPRRTMLSGWSISSLIKNAAESAGLDPANFGGHSLRNGWLDSETQTAK
ncbi:MAG TPA: hypothetical protein VKG38_15790 [Solirubrobacteraceae bacterium]|nr:hypothetical protein [Solirubrobacteraceae bacterium]